MGAKDGEIREILLIIREAKKLRRKQLQDQLQPLIESLLQTGNEGAQISVRVLVDDNPMNDSFYLEVDYPDSLIIKMSDDDDKKTSKTGDENTQADPEQSYSNEKSKNILDNQRIKEALDSLLGRFFADSLPGGKMERSFIKTSYNNPNRYAAILTLGNSFIETSAPGPDDN